MAPRLRERQSAPVPDEASGSTSAAPADGGFVKKFDWVYTDEPHATRRTQIQKKYPQVKKLMGVEPITKYIVAGLVVAYVALAYWVQGKSWFVALPVAYAVGATLSHILFLSIHEMSHNLAFKKPFHNKLMCMVANFPLVVPYIVSFKHYHREHHKYQGMDVVDTDIPTDWEAKMCDSRFKKVIFLALYILAYTFRPVFTRPAPITKMHLLNIAMQLTFDYLIVTFIGWQALMFMLLSVVLSGGLHPLAAHFISEHFVFVEGQETYSYYGPLNWLTFNVGYHQEHHDFPFIPWTRLPALRKMAPEFYDNEHYYTNWPKVTWDFVMSPTVSLYSRRKRPQKEIPKTMD